MTQVTAGEAVAAGIAPAAGLDGLQVVLVLGVADAHRAERGEVVAVARVAGRHDAVEHVHAARHRFHQVLGPAHAHEVARLVRRQLRAGVLQHRIAFGLGLADRQAADRVTVEADRLQPVRRARAQVVVHAALHDAEQRGVIALMGVLRSLRPAQRQFHGALDHPLVHRLSIEVHRRAFVEDHHDVAVQHLLDAHALFGPEEHLRPVHRRGERHALLGDLAAVRQREHLEAAGVGEDRLVPAREAMQAAVFADDLQPGPQVQVEGVAQDDLRTQVLDVFGQDALHRAVGAHRHEGRRLDGAARERQPATAGRAVGGQQIEGHAAHAAGLKPRCFRSSSRRRPGERQMESRALIARALETGASHLRRKRTGTVRAPHGRRRP